MTTQKQEKNIKTCKYCEAQFIPDKYNAWHQKFCSDNCRKRYHQYKTKKKFRWHPMANLNEMELVNGDKRIKSAYYLEKQQKRRPI